MLTKVAARAVNAAAVTITLLVIVWLLLACNKGLDVTDEGFYLLTAQHPGDVLMMPTSFYWISSWLLWATGGSIVWMRIVGVIGTAAAGAFLGWAVLAVSGGGRSWLTVSLVTMGALLAYAWLLVTPSYNTYNAWAVLITTACVLRAFAAADRAPFNRRQWCAWMFGAGLFLTLSLFVKFPTAVAMTALLTLSIAGWPRLPPHVRTAAFASLASGLVVATAFMFVAVVSPPVWWQQTSAGVELVTSLAAGHGFGAAGRYARELHAHLGEGTRPVMWLLWTLGFVSAAVAAGAATMWMRRAARAAIWIVVAVAVVRSALEMTAWLDPPAWPAYTIRDPFPFWIARFHLHWMILAVVVALGTWTGVRRRGRRTDHDASSDRARLIVGLLLAGGTMAGAFGTANPIYINLMLSLGSWLALLAIAARYASASLDWHGAGDATILAVMIFSAVQIVGGSSQDPYGLHEGLSRQTEATSIGSPATRLLLDRETERWLVELKRLAADSGFREGDDLLAFHNMPGVVYALGGRSPGLPWFTSGLPGSRVANEKGLKAAGAERVSRAFILQVTGSEAWLSTLAPLGIDFPRGYVYCGTITRHYRGLVFELKLWRPASIQAR